MKETYRETGVNKIPKDWKIVEIRNIGEVVTGTTPSTKIEKFWGIGVPFVTPTDFTVSKYVHKTERNVTLEGADQGRLVSKEAVMVTCIASVGEVAMASSECITNQQINTIICNNEINPDYIYYTIVFRKNDLKRWAGITTSPIIKKSMFEKFPLSLPPLPEQRKIAEILSTVDEAIEKVDQAIEKTERIKKGLMQELLTKGIGHKEFKDTEIGRIPKEWEVVKLGDIGNLQYGFTASAKQNDTGIKFLRITDIKDDGSINWVQVPYCEINESDFEKNKLNTGDILFARIGSTTGKTCHIDKQVKGVFASYLIRFQGERNIDTKFLYYYTQSTIYWLQANKHKEGQLKKGLNATVLSNLKLQLPSLPEQINIVDILSGVDEQLVLLKQKKLEFERIKKGLMNDLLTGKRRVKA